MGWIRVAKARLLRLHRCEQGDEGVNKLLIIALIVVPIVAALIIFKDELLDAFKRAWESLL